MTGNVSAEVSQDVQRRKTMTRMQKRDLRDAMSLTISTLGTAISIVALVMASPRSFSEARQPFARAGPGMPTDDPPEDDEWDEKEDEEEQEGGGIHARLAERARLRTERKGLIAKAREGMPPRERMRIR